MQFVVQTSQPYEQLQIMVDKLLESARQYPGMVNLDSDLKLNKPELKIDLDRDKVAEHGPRGRHASGARSRPCSAAAR